MPQWEHLVFGVTAWLLCGVAKRCRLASVVDGGHRTSLARFLSGAGWAAEELLRTVVLDQLRWMKPQRSAARCCPSSWTTRRPPSVGRRSQCSPRFTITSSSDSFTATSWCMWRSCFAQAAGRSVEERRGHREQGNPPGGSRDRVDLLATLGDRGVVQGTQRLVRTGELPDAGATRNRASPASCGLGPPDADPPQPDRCRRTSQTTAQGRAPAEVPNPPRHAPKSTANKPNASSKESNTPNSDNADENYCSPPKDWRTNNWR